MSVPGPHTHVPERWIFRTFVRTDLWNAQGSIASAGNPPLLRVCPLCPVPLRLAPPWVTTVERACFTGVLHIPAKVPPDLCEQQCNALVGSLCLGLRDQDVRHPRSGFSCQICSRFWTVFNDSILLWCIAYVLLCVCKFLYMYGIKMCKERKEKGFQTWGFGRCVSTFNLFT